MSGGAEPVDEVDLSAAEPPEPSGPSGAPGGGRRTRDRTRRRRLAVGGAAAVALLVLGGWQHERARDAARASAVQAAARAQAAQLAAEEETERAAGGRSAAAAATAAATRALTAVTDGSGAPPTWGAADVGARGGLLGGPLDLQVVGTWPASATGAQRTGFRLLTGLPAATGAHPCRVPGVRTGTWPQVLDPRAGTTCEVRSAGVRGTAVRTGATGEGTSRVQLREVVLVSEGRAAVVAAWSVGSADPPLDLPALGAVAAAVVVSAEPS